MDESATTKYNYDIYCRRKDFESLINESWNRCIDYGLNNMGEPNFFRISDLNMRELSEKHWALLEIASPYIEHLTQMKSNSIFGLATKDGELLTVEGNGGVPLKKLGYLEGYIHLELQMGTNAIGVCIEAGRPVVIWGREHFLEALKDWAGFAAPVYTTETGLEAVFFSMEPIGTVCGDFLSIVSMTAHSIGKQLELKIANEKLMNSQDEMQDTQNCILEASSVISHEVKNSLTNISAYVQLLQLDNAITKFRGDKILKEIGRVTRLIDDFRLLSKHKHGGVREHSLKETLQSLVDFMMPKAKLANVVIIFNPYKENIHIKADKSSLLHVFSNLIDNAIQAMKDGGVLKIDIKKEPKSHMALISFEDTGPGIPQEQIQHIFKIFHTTKLDGSGLGLHICETILRFYGGNIKAKSVEGKGTTFFVRLPISNDQDNHSID